MTMSKTTQRTSEWFASRKGKVTGSIAGAILGLSPHLTRDAVMRRMVRDWHGAEKEGNQTNVAMEYGTMNESIAQLAYTKKTGNLVHEVGFLHGPTWLGQKLEWLGASPDGIVEDEEGYTKVLEIKCPFGLRNEKEPIFKSIMEQPHYYAQLQIEMLCANQDNTDFYHWSQYGDMLETVSIDDGYLHHILPFLKAFYDEFLIELKNKAHLEPLLYEISSYSAHQLLNEYDDVCHKIDDLTARKAELMGKMVEMANGKNANFCGRKLQIIERAGSISYAKAIKELLPDADLSKYQGKPTTYWKLG